MIPLPPLAAAFSHHQAFLLLTFFRPASDVPVSAIFKHRKDLALCVHPHGLSIGTLDMIDDTPAWMTYPLDDWQVSYKQSSASAAAVTTVSLLPHSQHT